MRVVAENYEHTDTLTHTHGTTTVTLAAHTRRGLIMSDNVAMHFSFWGFVSIIYPQAVVFCESLGSELQLLHYCLCYMLRGAGERN